MILVVIKTINVKVAVANGFISTWSHLVGVFYNMLPIMLGYIIPIGLKFTI
jgi:hypothetical protein